MCVHVCVSRQKTLLARTHTHACNCYYFVIFIIFLTFSTFNIDLIEHVSKTRVLVDTLILPSYKYTYTFISMLESVKGKKPLQYIYD